MMPDFFSSIKPTDPVFINIRDLPKYRDLREFIERLWSIYYPYADGHFLSEIAHSFDQIFWEMYLGCALIENGFEIKYGEEGPDFNITTDDLQIWIEAVAPTAGTGDDSVNELPELEVQTVPDDDIILRLRSAIEGKLQQFSAFSKKGIIGSGDITIIAVSGRGIPLIFLDDEEIPYIIKSVLPFGNLKIEFDVKTETVNRVYYDYRDTIRKRSGSEVSTDVFLDSRYTSISAILYSAANVANHPEAIGSEFIIIHNPNSKNPLPRGTFKMGQECWIENGILRTHRW